MHTFIRMAVPALAILSLASCKGQSETVVAATTPQAKPSATMHPEDLPMKPQDRAKLVSIVGAQDVCPANLCPVGTKLYLENGILMGQVVESSKTMIFPSGKKKPGMALLRPRQSDKVPTQYEITPTLARLTYIKRK